MPTVLVDSNVLLDIVTEDTKWYDWSAEALRREADQSVLVINPIIYAEVSIRFERIEELDEALPDFYVGAHAAVAGLTLLMRDPARYRTYYPSLELIAPE